MDVGKNELKIFRARIHLGVKVSPRGIMMNKLFCKLITQCCKPVCGRETTATQFKIETSSKWMKRRDVRN